MAENLQREDLNVYEETLAVVGLIGVLLDVESIDETKALIFSSYNAIRRFRSSGDTSIPKTSLEQDGDTSIPKTFSEQDGDTGILVDSKLQIIERVIFDNLKGMSVSSFAKNRLSLLDLPSDIVAAIENGLPYIKALAIAKVEDVDARADLIKTVSNENFNVLEVKKLIKGLEPTNRAELELGNFKASPDLKVPKTRLTSLLRQVKLLKQFDRLEELNDLLDRMEALMS